MGLGEGSPSTLRSAQGRGLPVALASWTGQIRGWATSPPLRPAAELDRSGPATMRRLPRALLLPLQLAVLVAAAAPEAPVSAPRSLVWGPGLQADVVLPVRYFYLQAVSSEGRNLTRSPPGSVQPRASRAPPRVPAAPAPPGNPPVACVAYPRRPVLSPFLGSGHLLFPPLTSRRKGGREWQRTPVE